MKCEDCLKRVSQWTLFRDLYEATLSSEFFMSFIEKPTFYSVLSIEFETLRESSKIGEKAFLDFFFSRRFATRYRVFPAKTECLKRVSQWILSRDLYEATLSSI